MTLRAQILTDANDVFLNNQDFAEDITYIRRVWTDGSATATVSGGSVTAISVVSAGSAYPVAPTIRLTGGGGTGATATATINGDGQITAISVTAGGSGYTSAPTVQIVGVGQEVTVAAIVNRGPLKPREADNKQTLAWSIEILVSREDVPRVVVRGDAVKLKLREGDSATATLRVVEIIAEDYGMWRLGVAA